MAASARKADEATGTLTDARRRGGVVTQRPAKPFTPVRFRSSPLSPVPGRHPDRIESAVVFGGTSEIALATLDALAARGLRRVVLAVRDPAAAGGTPVLT